MRRRSHYTLQFHKDLHSSVCILSANVVVAISIGTVVNDDDNVSWVVKCEILVIKSVVSIGSSVIFGTWYVGEILVKFNCTVIADFVVSVTLSNVPIHNHRKIF